MESFFASFIGIAKAVIGVGVVIFVHELGHFLMAKRAGIRVEVFSLGFGPRLLGFHRGDTDYRISVVPIGGYVKMAGEMPGGESSGADDELQSKSVGQRAAVMSAGVIMNFLFAFLVFPLVFHLGVPMETSVVGRVEPGWPAWEAGVRTGDTVLAINGEEVFEFSDIQMSVALSDQSDGTQIKLHRPSTNETFEVHAVPRMNDVIGAYRIGIDPETRLDIPEDSAAYAAGLRDDDRVLAINGFPVADTYELINTLGNEPEQPLVVEVERESGERLELTIPPHTREGDYIIGVRRSAPSIEKVRLSGMPGIDFRPGDVLQAENGTPMHSWVELFEAWKKRSFPFRSETTVLRDGEETTIAFDVETKETCALVIDNIVPKFTDTLIVTPDSPAAEAGLQTGDEIVAIGDEPIKSFNDLVTSVRGSEGLPIRVTYRRGSEEMTTLLTARRNPADDRGIGLRYSTVIRRYPNILDACIVGFKCSVNNVKRVFLTLKSIIGGSVSAKNLGGPIAIFNVSYKYAKVDRLLFFLAILSINLAIINLLPIPVLDGGHLLFLLIEKIKGSPVSENVVGLAQWVGLILILALLLFVTYNDILRLAV